VAKLLKGQKSVVLPHYQQSSSFLLTPNHFSFFPPFLFFSFPPPFFSRDSFICLLILAYQVLKAQTEDHMINLIKTENRRPSKLCQLIPHVTHKLRFYFLLHFGCGHCKGSEKRNYACSPTKYSIVQGYNLNTQRRKYEAAALINTGYRYEQAGSLHIRVGVLPVEYRYSDA